MFNASWKPPNVANEVGAFEATIKYAFQNIKV